MKYSLFFIAFIMTLPIIGCNTFPIGFLSNEIGMDYSLPLQSTGAYDSGSVNYFEEPSLKLSASWKKMPNNPTEIVVQGRISQSLLLSVSFPYSNLTSYSWKGVVRTSDRETETRIDALYSDGNGDPFLQAIEKATIKRPSEPILD